MYKKENNYDRILQFKKIQDLDDFKEFLIINNMLNNKKNFHNMF